MCLCEKIICLNKLHNLKFPFGFYLLLCLAPAKNVLKLNPGWFGLYKFGWNQSATWRTLRSLLGDLLCLRYKDLSNQMILYIFSTPILPYKTIHFLRHFHHSPFYNIHFVVPFWFSLSQEKIMCISSVTCNWEGLLGHGC